MQVYELEQMNPWYYCGLWLEGNVEVTMRARSQARSNRPYDPDKELKRMIRHRVCSVLHANTLHPKQPRGEVILRLTTIHPLLKKHKKLQCIRVPSELFVGADYSPKDVDNISKIYMDVINPSRSKNNPLIGVLWQDDRQCCHLEVVKQADVYRVSTGVYLQAWYRKESMLETIRRAIQQGATNGNIESNRFGSYRACVKRPEENYPGYEPRA